MANAESQRSRLVVFDRDGVINRGIRAGSGERGPWDLNELHLTEGAPAAVRAAAQAGYRIVVATNQPDVARGDVKRSAVDLINEEIRRQIPEIEQLYVCFHDNADNCACRKPKPGMLTAAVTDFDADPAESWMVGDRWTDVLTGQAAGFRTVLILDENSMRETSIGGPPADLKADATVSTITEAVEAILAH